MVLKNINHDMSYNTQKICTAFFPLEKICADGESDITVITEKKADTLCVNAKVYDRQKYSEYKLSENEDMANAMSLLLFNALSELTSFVPPWGILYGVRPARLMHRKCEELGEQGAFKYFTDDCRVNSGKAKLALDVMKAENRIISLSDEKSFSLYASIPFCPSRCLYCSFVSHSIENASGLIEQYVSLLCEELKRIAVIAKDLGLCLRTVYFGGGTPTTLTAGQLELLLDTVEKHFDFSNLLEYTVEAGRPDTVTAEKLEVLKHYGVTRISINPQTFNDEVLKNIGRRHTVQQTIDAFNLAEKLGFDNINMDLIAGLDGDTLDSFKNSVDRAVDLQAQSITVHNLSLKSGAFLVTENKNYDLSMRDAAGKMIDYSALKLRENGYFPYYMYRQSKSLGNLENVGWCKNGRECLYNVYMMDETHTVLAAGAGAVTKLKNQQSGHIDRIYNYKYPYEYINGFEEIIKRKSGIYDFYKS
ncbi:MAG: coproporphyrinogen dehydrogenase HemZ [Eubacterium sp.]